MRVFRSAACCALVMAGPAFSDGHAADRPISRASTGGRLRFFGPQRGVDDPTRISETAVLQTSLPPVLARRQLDIQAGKPKSRGLGYYNLFLFNEAEHLYEEPGEGPLVSPVRLPQAPSLKALFHAGRNLQTLLNEMHASQERMVHWSDWGGGLGMAQRQMGRFGGLGEGQLLMTTIDVVDWRAEGAGGDFPDAGHAGQTSKAVPRLVLSDVAEVRFPAHERPDLITSIESVQYWDDKIKALVNAYNQLRDGGMLAVAARHAWGAQVRTRGNAPEDDPRLDVVLKDRTFEAFLQAVAAGGIELLAWVPRADYPLQAVTRLVIQKKPGTALAQEARLAGLSEGGSGYKTSFYEPTPPGTPPVRVLSR